MYGNITRRSTSGHVEAQVCALLQQLELAVGWRYMARSSSSWVGTQPGWRASKRWTRCMTMCGLWTYRPGRYPYPAHHLGSCFLWMLLQPLCSILACSFSVYALTMSRWEAVAWASRLQCTGISHSAYACCCRDTCDGCVHCGQALTGFCSGRR